MSETGLFQPIRIDGLNALRKNLKAAGEGAEKEIRPALNEAAMIVVKVARPRVPSLTGKARASLGVSSTGNKVRVKAGGTRAPYFPWLDYGGSVGRGRTGKNPGTVYRPFERHGRYIYPAYWSQSDNIRKLIATRLEDVIKRNGLDVT